MMNKETFVTIINELDSYFNGDISEGFDKLGIYENNINRCFDNILTAIDKEMDPECYAEEDPLTCDCGSFVCCWLFCETEFQEKCPTAEALYDYIEKKYNEAPNDDSTQLKVEI